VKPGYKYRVGKRGREKDLDSGVNRESLASQKPGDFIVIVHICSSLFYCYFQLQTQIHTLEYYSVTPLSTILLLLLLDTFTIGIRVSIWVSNL